MRKIVAILCPLILITFITSNRAFNKFDLFEKELSKINKYSYCFSSYRNTKGFDDPAAAEWQNFLMTFDPKTGYVPLDRLETGYQIVRNNETYRSGEQLLWQEVPTDLGGRIRAIMQDPNDAKGKKVWAGSVTGGLWYNNDITDSNSSWKIVDDFWESLSISSICFDPNNKQVFYAGTGEAFTARIIYRESSGKGIGIMKSADGGNTWTKLASTSGFEYVTDVVVRNENGKSVVYAGVASGTYQGKNHNSKPSDGLYRSTDGGTTWTQVLPDINGETVPFTVSDIEISANNRLFVGTMNNLSGKGAATILFSDSGKVNSWTIIDSYRILIEGLSGNNVPGRVVLSSAPSNGNTIYGLIGSGYITTEGFNYSYCKHIIKSTDGGKTWTNCNLPNVTGNGFATIAWHALAVKVDPNNENRIFIGGLDVFRSENAGNTWTKMSDWALMYNNGGNKFVHADIHSFHYLNASSQKLLISTDGGIFYTENATDISPIFLIRNHNLNCFQYYSCDINPMANVKKYVGGLQDNGTMFYNDTPLKLKDMINGGDGAYCFFDKDYPSMIISSIYYNRYQFIDDYQFYANAGIQSGTFISPSDYNSQHNLLVANAVTFAGDNSDQVLLIDALVNPPSSSLIKINTNSKVIFSAITISPKFSSNHDVVLVGTQSGRLFEINKLLSTPEPKDIGSKDFPTANISSISCGKTEDTILVTFSNYGVSSVWITFNHGKSWREIENNIPDIPVRWGAFHPKNSYQVILASELGIWICNNIANINPVWTIQTSGIGNVRTDMIRIRETDNTVLAATHGRGMYTAIWPLENRPIKAKFLASKTTINFGDSILFTDISEGLPVSWNWYFPGGQPSFFEGQKPPYIKYIQKGIFDVSLVVKNKASDADSLIKPGMIVVENTGLNNDFKESGIVYPTITCESLYVKSIKTPYSVEIIDLTGNLVYSKNDIKVKDIKIDITNLTEGVYFVKMKYGGKQIIYKIIKMN